MERDALKSLTPAGQQQAVVLPGCVGETIQLLDNQIQCLSELKEQLRAYFGQATDTDVVASDVKTDVASIDEVLKDLIDNGPSKATEISSRLGVSPPTIYNRLNKLRQRVKKMEGGRWAACDGSANGETPPQRVPVMLPQEEDRDERFQPLEAFLDELTIGQKLVVKKTGCKTPMELRDFGRRALRHTEGAGPETPNRIAEWLSSRFRLELSE
jgi:hypothetical protein